MTRDQILLLAQSVADGERWPWKEPIDVRRGRRYGIVGRIVWSITTNIGSLGSNVRIQIDDETGMVVSKAFGPR